MWMPREIAKQPCANGLLSTAPGAPHGPASPMAPPAPTHLDAASMGRSTDLMVHLHLDAALIDKAYTSAWAPAQLATPPMMVPEHCRTLQSPAIQLLQQPVARRPGSSSAASTSRRCAGRNRTATTPLSQPRLLSAPTRSPIARRRSQEDLRVDRVLDSMTRSPSMVNLRALERMAAVLPPAFLAAREAASAGKRATTPTTPTNADVPQKLEVQQAEKDVSKMMAEMAAMAC